MRSCDDVLDLVPEVLPHLPPLAARQVAFEVQEHLRLCPSCADAAEEMARVTAALQAAPAAPALLSSDFADRVMDALPPAPGQGLGRAGPALLRAAAAVALFAGGFAAAGLREPPACVDVVPAPQPPQVIVLRPDPETELAPATRVVRAERPRAVDGSPAAGSPSLDPLTPDPRRGSVTDRRASGRAAPFERYVTEANLVLEAVTALEEPDPHWLGVISRHVDEAALLAQGERLLVQLQRVPDRPEAQALRPLINATQVVLRKVRHASDRDPAATLSALRHEVQDAGLLDAYRALLAPAAAPPEADPRPQPGITDPL